MPRATAAFAVLALLSVAQAERTLLAHKASGGSSLHALALTDSYFYTSNGNGTWASRTNRAYTAASACGGSSFGGAATAFAPPAPYTAANPNQPLPFYKTGHSVTSVSFPSRLLGVAVGTGCTTTAGWTDPDFSTWTTAASQATSFVPTILTTFDQGATWQPATGFSTATTKSFAQTKQYTTASPPVVQKFTVLAPDLVSVHCTTRSLCFAAGGYFGSAAISAVPTTGNWLDMVNAAVPVTGPAATPSTNLGTIKTNVMPVAGTVLRSTNGGTFWNYVTLPVQTAATATAGPVPIPGLNDISTDSSGRHVYAVGAPFLTDFTNGAVTSLYTYPAQDGGEPYSAAVHFVDQAAGSTTAVNQAVSGTIIYSGAYGVTNSWVVQTAPKIPNYFYGLNAVTVLRGTTAIAVGGSPFGVNAFVWNKLKFATAPATPLFANNQANAWASSGVILMTFNGGFSWIQQGLPSWSFWSGTNNVIQPDNAAISNAGASTNTYFTALNTTNNLPGLNDVACYATTVGTAPYYNCMAVGDTGYVVKAQYPAVTVSNTVITSTTSWTYQNITQVSLSSGYLDVYGITWDNNKVGYMYGYQTILSTHDGGVTWVSETPNNIISGAADNDIVSLATVPTTY